MRVGLLGPLQLVDDGGEPLGVPGPAKERAVLALLALRASRTVRMPELVDALWGDDPPRSAVKAVQTYVSALRRTLPAGLVETVGDGYRLALAPDQVDVNAFEAFATRGRERLIAGDHANAADCLREGLGLFRGEPLVDLCAQASGCAEATRLVELRRDVEECLAEARLELGEHAQLVGPLEAAVAAEPLRERRWALLMRALYRSGRQADALRAYQRLRETLAEQLGIDPSPALQDLERAVLAQDRVLDPPNPTREPSTVTGSPTDGAGGIRTLLFTDIEGSTKMLERLGDGYSSVLRRHRELLRAAFELRGGVVVGSEGDSLFVVFEKASAAVAAAVQGQLALRTASWAPGSEPKVRMGLHTGEADVVDGSHVGMAVNVAARVSAAAHGGQILVSSVTAQLAGGPDACDLGPHRLKDVGEVHLFQLRAPGLDEDFPPPRSLSALPNNLPAPVDSFIGRTTEMAELRAKVAANRLVTLTGPGGSGKTRLALEAAALLLPEFPDGVWLVPLGAGSAGERLVEVVAEALGVADRPGQEMFATLADWLKPRKLLLVLDNCEHLVGSVASLCERLLTTCPALRILATSREVLAIRGEHAMATPPMTIPSDMVLAPLCDAVSLFIERASAAAPNWHADRADLTKVAQVCQRLDGLPLAIELAASRLRTLPLDRLAARLDDRFRLLGQGTRTLEAVVAWSYDLLTEDERDLFRRLSVFPHHFSLEMCVAVAAQPPLDEEDVVELLGRLVDKSLVSTVEVADEMRYALLETLRQYAWGRLVERGEDEQTAERLLHWAMDGVLHLESVMRSPEQDDALRRAAGESVTYRQAMRWASERGRFIDALRISAAVPLGHDGERHAEITSLFEQARAAGPLPPVITGHAWAAISNLAGGRSEWEESVRAGRSAAAAFEEAGETRLAGWARYFSLHSAWGAGWLPDVDEMLEATIAGFRESGDEMGLGYSLWVASLRDADLDRAAALGAEADRLLRSVHVPMGIAHNVEGRGIIAFEQGNAAEAARFIAEAVQIFADYDNVGCTAHALETAAVLIASDAAPNPSPVAHQLIAAAAEFRRRSGQGHRPWEVRSRLDDLDDLIGTPAATDGRAGYSLTAAAGLATDTLRSLMSKSQPT